LDSDLIEICEAIISENLNNTKINFKNLATVCKYAVPDGYPDDPVKGHQIDVSEVKNKNMLFYASVENKNGNLIQIGSRAIAVVGHGETIWEAEQIAQKKLNHMSSIK
jgi:phosphoribosylamine--glycine ligase